MKCRWNKKKKKKYPDSKIHFQLSQYGFESESESECAKSFTGSWDRTRWPPSRSPCHCLHWEGLSFFSFDFNTYIYIYFNFFRPDFLEFLGLMSDNRGGATSIKEVSLFFFLVTISFLSFIQIHYCFHVWLEFRVMLWIISAK